MDANEQDPVLAELARLVGDVATADKLAPVLSRVTAVLARAPKLPQAWEPLPTGLFGAQIPAEVKSCWVFALRAAAVFGSERHPNSHQRTIALNGTALFEVLRDGVWQQRPVDGTRGDPLDGGCVSIPSGAWHRIRIGPENFLSVSFHTVPASELIEETPVGDDLAVTHRRLYSS